MAWSAALLEYLEGDRSAEVWLVEVYQSSSEPGADGYTMSNCAGYGDEVLVAGPPRISGARVTPVVWSSTIGACSIQLVGDLSTAMQHIARGTVCRVLLGRPTVPTGRLLWGQPGLPFETVFWGQVWSLTGSAPSYVLELRDPIQAIDGRMAIGVTELFSGLGATTLTADAAAADTTLTVASTTNWVYDQFGSGYGLLKIENEYIAFTGTTATTFTGCIRGSLGTTADAYVIGDAVAGVALLQGHPLDVARRVLLSHSEAGNGAFDTYDYRWGLAIRQTLVDVEDIERWKVIVAVASGSYVWNVVSETIQDAPGSWLTGMLSRAGLFLTTRHGLLTIRAATSPLVTLGDPPLLDLTITDDDIVAGWGSINVEAWASEYNVEYLLVAATTESGTTTTSATGDGLYAATLPAARLIEYDVSDLVRQNESEVRTEMLNRLALMAQRVPEAVTFTAAGMRLAQLTPGDVVYFETTRAGLRFAYPPRRCWVAQVSPDWSRNTVQVRVLAYPGTFEEFES